METKKRITRSSKDLLNVVLLEDVLKRNEQTKQWELGMSPLTADEKRSLKAEAEFLKKTRLWSILTNSLEHQAQRVMFEKSQNWDDMVNGKNILYCVHMQKMLVEILLNFT